MRRWRIAAEARRSAGNGWYDTTRDTLIVRAVSAALLQQAPQRSSTAWHAINDCRWKSGCSAQLSTRPACRRRASHAGNAARHASPHLHMPWCCAAAMHDRALGGAHGACAGAALWQCAAQCGMARGHPRRCHRTDVYGSMRAAIRLARRGSPLRSAVQRAANKCCGVALLPCRGMTLNRGGVVPIQRRASSLRRWRRSTASSAARRAAKMRGSSASASSSSHSMLSICRPRPFSTACVQQDCRLIVT